MPAWAMHHASTSVPPVDEDARIRPALMFPGDPVKFGKSMLRWNQLMANQADGRGLRRVLTCAERPYSVKTTRYIMNLTL